jgi:hypothetical protein
MSKFDEWLATLSKSGRAYYSRPSPRGYYDKGKYKRTAAADLKHTSPPEDQDPPQR